MKNTYRFGCFLLAVICLFSFLTGCADNSEDIKNIAPVEEAEIIPESDEAEGTTPIREDDGAEMPPDEAFQEGEPVSEAAAPLFTYPAFDRERYPAVCATTGVNVRAGAGMGTAVVGYLGTGRSLPYLETEGGWYKVWKDGAVGYVSAAYAYLADTCRAIERIVDAGLDKLGTPYVWGAPRIINEYGEVSPYFTGKSFDCSSFVQYCYYVGDGVKLGNYTGSQADYTVGKVITRYEELRRGDFYFTGNGSISHVVIYMGGGRLLQAYSANGGPVSFTTDDRWRGKFISGRSVDLSVKDQFAANAADR
ncbi:MAG: C40 family peptidase [Clostridia bacterium]|nr:C40 family peptidase [Clostridia bacterium]